MTTGKPYAGSGMDVLSVGPRAPAPLHVSYFIAGVGSILLLFGALTLPASGAALVVAATLMLVLWSGVLFDWFVSRSARVQTVTTPAPVQLERPSRVPPSPTRLDRAA